MTENSKLKALALKLKKQVLLYETEIADLKNQIRYFPSPLDEYNLILSLSQDQPDFLSNLQDDTPTSNNSLTSQDRLISLEIADYERTVRNLTASLSISNDKLNAEKEINTSLKQNLNDLLNEKEKSLQEASKFKSDFEEASAELTREISERKILDLENAKLEKSLESFQILQKELVSDAREKEIKLLEQLAAKEEDVRDLQKSFDDLKLRHYVLESESSENRDMYEKSCSEFKAYKVRVHNVFKTQQCSEDATSPKNSECQNEPTLKANSAIQESALKRLKLQIEESEAKFARNRSYYENLLKEQERVFDKEKGELLKEIQRKRAQDARREDKLALLELRLEESEKEIHLLKTNNSNLLSQKEKMKSKRDVACSSDSLCGNSNDVSGIVCARTNSSFSGSEEDSLKKEDLVMSGRQSFANSYAKPRIHLGKPSSETQMNQQTGRSQVHHLPHHLPSQETLNARRNCTHLSKLLNDSESMVSNLSQQAKILKDEIRRLENNAERSNTLNCNAEYVKNVILKFILSKSHDEKLQIIPALHTLLKLTQSETERIKHSLIFPQEIFDRADQEDDECEVSSSSLSNLKSHDSSSPSALSAISSALSSFFPS